MFNIKTPKFLCRISTSLRGFLVARLLALRNKVCLGKRFLPGRPAQIRVYDLVDAGPRHRFTTAQFLVSNCLGLGYGCGWEKFIKVAQTLAGLDITIGDPETVKIFDEATGAEVEVSGYGWTSKQIVKAFRDSNPKIVALWRKLDEAFKGSVGEDFVMTLPSGRKLTYRGVKREIRIIPDPDNPGKTKSKSVFTADTGDRREIFYGGKLVENLVQAISRDVFAWHLLEFRRNPKIDVLFSCHDEAVVEMDPRLTAKDLEGIMSNTPPWLPGCPVSAEAKIVEHYCK